MQLIVLEGYENVGKTTTLTIVYKVLKRRKGYNKNELYNKPLSNNDFLVVFKLNNLIVGIVTQGDYAITSNSVQNHLLILKSYGCNIAICAATLGQSKGKIQTAISQYPIIPPSPFNKQAAAPLDHTTEDNKYANMILALV